MQGTIQVESVYGEGTTFTIEIPQKIVDNSFMGRDRLFTGFSACSVLFGVEFFL